MTASAGTILGTIWILASLLSIAFAFRPRIAARQESAISHQRSMRSVVSESGQVISSCALYGLVAPCRVQNGKVYEDGLD